MIYLSFVGNHDEIKPAGSYGPALTIFAQYKESIDKVYIFVTPAKESAQADYPKIAQQNKQLILAEKSEVEVELVQVTLRNPVDFDLVYPTLLQAITNVLAEKNNLSADKIINITSGTPTMTACWVLLHKSGLILSIKLRACF